MKRLLVFLLLLCSVSFAQRKPISTGGLGNGCSQDGSGNLTCVSFIGALTGAASTSTIVNDTTTNATMYMTWVATGAGSRALKISTTGVTWNPSTGTFTVPILAATTSIASGTAPTTCGSATGCFGATGAATAGSQVAGQGYIRLNATQWVLRQVNGAAETNIWTAADNTAANVPVANVVIVAQADSSPITVSTTLNGAYYYNQHTTEADAITFNLPATAVGKQFCFTNSYGDGTVTGALTITPAASSYIINKGVLSTVSKGWVSGGAAGDSACVVGTDATHWTLHVGSGTWTAVP